MSKLIVPDAVARTMLGNAIGAGGALQHVVVRLFTNDLTPSKVSGYADFTEAAFPGYGSTSITWSPVWTPPGGGAQVNGDAHFFQPSDASAPTLIYGWFGGGTGAESVTLKGAERFDEPIGLNGPADLVIVLPAVQLAPDGSAYITGG